MAGIPPPSLWAHDPKMLIPNYDGPKMKHRTKYMWDEESVDPDLPFVVKTKRIMDTTQNIARTNDREFTKTTIKKELEQMGWQFNRIDTFKANFPFRSKWLIFDSRVWLDEKDIYRIKVEVKRGRLFGYKLLKWKANTYPGFELLEWLLSPRVLKAILIFVVLFFILMGAVLSKCWSS